MDDNYIQYKNFIDFSLLIKLFFHYMWGTWTQKGIRDEGYEKFHDNNWIYNLLIIKSHGTYCFEVE